MSRDENEKERAARKALEQHLAPEEYLLEYSRFKSVGFFRTQSYLMGLTRFSLILVPLSGGLVQDPTCG